MKRHAGRWPLRPLKEFYWTVTRLVGLAHLHDGSRPKAETRWWTSRIDRARRTNAGPAASMLLPATPRTDQAPLRILVDTSASAVSPSRTGIQRYVREFARSAREYGYAQPVVLRAGLAYDAYACDSPARPIDLREGDIALLLDANWGNSDGMALFIERLKAAGGHLVAFFHDVIPLTFPLTCETATEDSFRRYFDLVADHADAFITSTAATAADLRACLLNRPRRPSDDPWIGWVAPGTSLLPISAPSRRARLEAVCRDRGAPVLVSVGTIEPRKGYSVALDGLEILWGQGASVRYVVIGRRGWGMTHLEHRLVTHREYGKRLFWLDDADDGELAFAYRHAAALLMPSIEEGCGLPLLEAARFGLPVIASDIPVFREVTGGKAIFFEPCDPVAVADAVMRALAKAPEDPRRIPAGPSWRETVEAMTRMIRTQTYQSRYSFAGSAVAADGGDGRALGREQVVVRFEGGRSAIHLPKRPTRRAYMSLPLLVDMSRRMIEMGATGRGAGDLVVDVGDIPAAGADVGFVRAVGDTAALIPDLYYFQEEGYKTFRTADDRFRTKRKAIWRGSTTGNLALRLESLSALPRYRLCDIARHHPDIIDAKFTAVVQAVSERDHHAISARLEDLDMMAPAMSVEEVFRHEIVVDIDGNASSWGFVRRALSGCCILKVTSNWEQWYGGDLVPWEHFVPVASDMADLVETVRHLLATPELSCRIGRRAREWALNLNFDDEVSKASRRCVDKVRVLDAHRADLLPFLERPIRADG